MANNSLTSPEALLDALTAPALVKHIRRIEDETQDVVIKSLSHSTEANALQFAFVTGVFFVLSKMRPESPHYEATVSQQFEHIRNKLLEQ